MWIQNRNRTLDSDSATYESDSDSNLHDSDSKSDSTTHDSESGIKSGFGFRFVLWFRLRIRNRPRSDAYTFLTPSAKQQNVIWLGWVFQAWCPANMSYVGKLTTAFIAIINFGRQESHLQSTQYEPRSHAQNTQPTMSGDCRPVFRVVAYRLP